LRQHAHNPVEWYPWGEEALALARSARRPILLSIGYAACHWCHVMARESFENPAIAAVMNENFVNIKVDREERPDVDTVYMSAVQAMTGSGGWPLTVFLTPDGEPFYGGTYFPPVDRGATPSFGRVLTSLAQAWRERGDEVADSAARLTEHLKGLETTYGAADGSVVDVPGLLVDAIRALAAAEDDAGGFGGAPKFPPHAALALLLASGVPAATAMAERTLDAMAAGGVHDHLGGGFFRYSVDSRWRLPHFEKMLYDNAQLLSAYVNAAAVVSDGTRYRLVATRIIAWLERELAVSASTGGVVEGGWHPASDETAFYSATDADSEGEEGRFYAWTEAEFKAVVSAAEERCPAPPVAPGAPTPAEVATLAARHFGVTAAGAFEAGNVLYVATPAADLALELGVASGVVAAALSRATAALFEHRTTRVRPATDDKVVTSMNGLLLAALSDAGRLLGDEKALDLARRLATFVHRRLWRDNRLFHLWRAGEVRVEGLLEDYAYVGLGLLAYYRATFEPWALTWAFDLADQCEARFADVAGGGFFTTASDADPLLVRPKGRTDGATPSESVAAAELVWWAARYRSDMATAARALSGLGGVERGIRAAPQAFASSLRLLVKAARPAREVVVVGAGGSDELADLLAAFRLQDDGTDVVLVVASPERLLGPGQPLGAGQPLGPGHPLADLPLLEGRVDRVVEGALAYVCHGGACELPVGDPAALSALLRSE